jgi:hypothetical protein
MPTRRLAQRIVLTSLLTLVFSGGRPAFAQSTPEVERTQTNGHGYFGAGVAMAQCVNGCWSPDPTYEEVLLISGGFAYPLIKGRLWIAGDVNSHVVSGYFDASGGPSVIFALGSLNDHRVEPFAQAGPRWGDGGNLRWNAGAGTNLWLQAHFGVRVEYQYQWENATFVEQTFGPMGPVGPETRSKVTLSEHMIRVGIAIR